MWDVGGKDRDSSFQEGVSHTYTLRLDYSKNSILYQKKHTHHFSIKSKSKKKKRKKNLRNNSNN